MMNVATFPIEDGVEIRTMGQTMRPLRLYFPQTTGAFSTVNKMLVVDDENHLFLIVPDVTKLIIDHDANKGCVAGRLVRMTSDVIEHVESANDNFRKGYMRTLTQNAKRLVSEPFFIMSVEAVDATKFDELRSKARCNFEKQNGEASLGWD